MMFGIGQALQTKQMQTKQITARRPIVEHRRFSRMPTSTRSHRVIVFSSAGGFARLPQLLMLLLVCAAVLFVAVQFGAGPFGVEPADPDNHASYPAERSRVGTAASANHDAQFALSSAKRSQTPPVESSNSAAAATPNPEYTQGAQQRAQQQMQDEIAAFRAARAEAIGNLQQWLHDFWLRCQHEFAGECQALLARYHAQLSAEEQQWLEQMLARYQQYQAELGQVQLSTALSPRDRFDVIDKMRNRLFADETDVLFGQEQRLAQYQFGLDQLVQQQAPLLTPTQRLDALMTLQQQLTTQLPRQLRHEITGAEATFQQALLLLQDVPANERQPLLQQLAEQLFADKAPSVLAYQKQIEQQRAQQQAYVQALQQLEQDFALKRSQMTDAQWQAAYADALTQLRRQFFG